MGGEFMDRAREVKKHAFRGSSGPISQEMGSDPIYGFTTSRVSNALSSMRQTLMT
jgi:hypothetical protein